MRVAFVPTACWHRLASLARSLDRLLHRFEDLVVARAAAEIAGKGFLDLGQGRMSHFFHQVGGRHEDAGRAVAALHRARVDERLLQRMQRQDRLGHVKPGASSRSRRQPFDRDDLAARGAFGRHQAAHHGHAVQPDRAGAALAFGAAFLGAGQTGILAQRAQQGLAVSVPQRDRLPVQREGYSAVDSLRSLRSSACS